MRHTLLQLGLVRAPERRPCLQAQRQHKPASHDHEHRQFGQLTAHPTHQHEQGQNIPQGKDQP